VIPVVLLVVVLAGLAVVWAVVVRDNRPEPLASILHVPSPTPTVDAVPREGTTAFASALPTSVLQYALVSSEEEPHWITLGALEAYVEDFSDGASGVLTLRAGQWEAEDEADRALTELTEGSSDAQATASPSVGGMSRVGKVQVDHATVGRYVVTEGGDGTATITWSNTTAVFQITGPTGEVVRAYSAFPL